MQRRSPRSLRLTSALLGLELTRASRS